MAKLFIQELPSHEELQSSISRLHENSDPWVLYSNLQFLKVATELENQFDSFLAPYNLSSGRFTLLYILNDTPAGIIPSELSHRVGVTQATISGLINSMEKAELVKREMHEKDGRSFVIKLTDKGQTLIRELIPQWVPKVSSFWGQFSADERPLVSSILEKMVKHTGAITK
ncbi:transcriptional regulator [Bdellovibrio bacteriovorus]|uniref:Transcriptional regulator n=1 Tax=Bdellovibrio bacteriovorus TaxID=959 RepID=A0A150WNT8_BDEBC|nr:MarR family transcriptional regulator [Bdellovibrio bacteriovorus]KYG65959.1 transcriptional regulator [Bdellovibrio bacteriovorus]